MNKELIEKIKHAIFQQNQTHNNCPGDLWDAAYEAIKEAGYAVVPVEPTEAMRQTGRDCVEEEEGGDFTLASIRIWADMIEAAEGE